MNLWNIRIIVERFLYTLIIIMATIFLGLVSDCGRRILNFNLEFFFSYIGPVSIVVGTIVAIVTLRGNKKINYARFFSELNRDMINDDSYGVTLRKLGRYVSGDKLYVPFNEDDEAAIVNYLSYFVVIGVMLDKGALKLKDINEAYAWRFFAAMDNPDIQKLELEKYSDYNRQLFRLYYEWNRFREGQQNCKFPIEDENLRLINNAVYKKLLRTGVFF